MLTLTSRITDVVVYRRGAVVARQAKLSAVADEFQLHDLPVTMKDGSVRLSVVGQPELAPLDVHVELAWPGAIEAALTPLERKLDDKTRELQTLSEARDRLLAELAWFDRIELGLGDPHDDEAMPATPLSTWLEALTWLADERQRRVPELTELDAKITDKSREQADAARALDEAQGQAAREATRVYKRVRFKLAGAAAGAEVRLEYQVPGARWAPSYVARLDRDCRHLQLQARAQVTQRTGEVWADVRLSLSTAELTARTALPKLKSIRIGRAAPEPLRAQRPPPTGNDVLFGAHDSWLSSHPAPVHDIDLSEWLRQASQPERPRPAPRREPKAKKSAPRPPVPPPPSAMPIGAGSGFMPPGAPPMVQAAMPPPAPRPMSAPRTMMAMDTAAPAMAMAESSMAPMKEAMKRRSRADDDESDMPMDPEPQMDEGFGGMAAESAAPDELQTNGASALPDDYAELTVRSASAAARGKLRRQEAAHGPMADEVARQLRMAQDLDDSSAVAAAFEATSRDAWFDHRYDGESTVFVPCDGQVHTVTIVTRRAAIALEHILVPRVSSEAIRQARFSNPLDRPLLGGPCDVYVGDEFLVTSSLPTANAGEFLNLGLGVDEALKVARHAFFAEEKEGLLKGSLQLTHRIETKIASRLDVETTLEVREAIPIAGSEKDAPTIEVGRVEPEWTSLDTEMTKQGHYLWRFVLKPGEEKTLHHAYRIKIDGNEELVGGNRREAT